MDYKELTKESYEKNADAHAKKFHKGLVEYDGPILDDFINNLQGKKILDIGCGSGDHAKYFMDKGLEVLGIDISPAMIALTKEKGVPAKIIDIEDMNFEEKSFNGVWTFNSLLHIPKEKIPPVIEKIHHLLKEKGIFFICLFKGEEEGLKKDKYETNTQRFFAFWQEKELCKALEKNFTILSSKEVAHEPRTFIQILAKKK